MERPPIYPEGTKAVCEASRDKLVPSTIVSFLQGPSRPGFELHRIYQFTVDGDDEQEVAECRATRMNRLAGVGDRSDATSGDEGT